MFGCQNCASWKLLKGMSKRCPVLVSGRKYVPFYYWSKIIPLIYWSKKCPSKKRPGADPVTLAISLWTKPRISRSS